MENSLLWIEQDAFIARRCREEILPGERGMVIFAGDNNLYRIKCVGYLSIIARHPSRGALELPESERTGTEKKKTTKENQR